MGRSKNVRIFGGAPKNDERNYWQGWRPRIEITKALGIYDACVLKVIPNYWNILL